MAKDRQNGGLAADGRGLQQERWPCTCLIGGDIGIFDAGGDLLIPYNENEIHFQLEFHAPALNHAATTD
jgi:hypothetical protein